MVGTEHTMAFLNWEPNLLLGVDEMDTEHKVLIAKMNEIHDRVAAGASKTVLSPLLDGLADVTKKHFAHEEAMMRAAGYAGLENHAWVHKDLLTKLDKHLQAFRAGTGTIGDDFFSFLRLWLTAHIQGIDKKYAPVLGKRVA
jgi:hemerythrin-like metal-binding protein